MTPTLLATSYKKCFFFLEYYLYDSHVLCRVSHQQNNMAVMKSIDRIGAKKRNHQTKRKENQDNYD